MSRGYRVQHTYGHDLIMHNGHPATKINVRLMSGAKYTFFTQRDGETYKDLKEAFLNVDEIKPKRLLRQLIFTMKSDNAIGYTVVDDKHVIPHTTKEKQEEIVVRLDLLIVDIKWLESEKWLRTQIAEGDYIRKDDIRWLNEVFLWSLQEENEQGEKIKKLNIGEFDMTFVFNIVNANTNIEELAFAYFGRDINQPDDLRIDNIKKLTLNGRIDAQTVMNIVRQNRQIENLTIWVDAPFTADQMGELFDIIDTTNVTSLSIGRSSQESQSNFYSKHTYRMKDLTKLLKNSLSLLTVSIIEGKVEIKDRDDVIELKDALEGELSSKSLFLSKQKIISSDGKMKECLTSLTALKDIIGNPYKIKVVDKKENFDLKWNR
jgi:hypothetical protein